MRNLLTVFYLEFLDVGSALFFHEVMEIVEHEKPLVSKIKFSLQTEDAIIYVKKKGSCFVGSKSKKKIMKN